MTVPVDYSLLGKGRLESLSVIYSHPRVFRICGEQLDRIQMESELGKLERRETESTSEAAKKVAAMPGQNAAAIAHPLQADMWGLRVLKEGLADGGAAFTRFLIVGNERPRQTADDRTLLCFRTSNRPGALVDALLPIRQRDINMTLITSIPVEKEPEIYSFFVEFDGHREHADVQKTLDEIKPHCLSGFPKILGSYPRNQSVD